MLQFLPFIIDYAQFALVNFFDFVKLYSYFV